MPYNWVDYRQQTTVNPAEHSGRPPATTPANSTWGWSWTNWYLTLNSAARRKMFNYVRVDSTDECRWLASEQNQMHRALSSTGNDLAASRLPSLPLNVPSRTDSDVWRRYRRVPPADPVADRDGWTADRRPTTHDHRGRTWWTATESNDVNWRAGRLESSIVRVCVCVCGDWICGYAVCAVLQRIDWRSSDLDVERCRLKQKSKVSRA